MFETLSDIQKQIVFEKNGQFVVRACPGSGKTYSVAARLAHNVRKWDKKNQGIATISFTNVACEEIERKVNIFLSREYSLGFPHFLGTIDSFINKFIFLPHGHLIMQCDERPKIVGEPHGIWTGRYFADSFFDNISFNADGTFYAITPSKMPRNWQSNSQIVNSKKRLIKTGFANQSDANFFAMKVLERFPCIAKGLAIRFPMVIIDEAQDTSDIQMRILDLLIENGLSEVMLVGDPDQAIFEWNNARPDLLVEKFQSWSSSITLNENWRSSQCICNFTYNLSSLPKASVAVNKEVKACTIGAKVLIYSNPKEAIRNFLETCRQLDIPLTKESSAVLYRSKSLGYEILDSKELPFNVTPWPAFNDYTKDLAKGKFMFDNNEKQKGFRLLERGLLKMFKSLSHCSEETIRSTIEKIGFTKFKTTVYNFISILPNTSDVTIGEWVDLANKNFESNNIKQRLTVEKKARIFTFKQVFLVESDNIKNKSYRQGTIHSVKGETFLATLVLLKERGSIHGKYSSIIKKSSISNSEELRIVYVGITRPQRLLMIAVPDEENKRLWENKLNPSA